jgi:MOSC domain-containing protein YiiM
MGFIETICTSAAKGTVKTPVTEAEFRAGYGIVGDAHAGDWPRQVSILARESIEAFRRRCLDGADGPIISDGAFGENLITSGVDLAGLKIGDRILVGDRVVLEVTQIGKECHEGCAIRELTGDCIMPREGIFCRMVQGGMLRPGDAVSVVKVSP